MKSFSDRNITKTSGAAAKNLRAVCLFSIFAILPVSVFAQAKSPVPKTKIVVKTTNADTPSIKVTQIDSEGLKKLLKPEGKPVLINFWATWCDPCREEFPDLVKIDEDYRGKLDVITVSLDFLSEINRDVPKFLSQMKAEMPAYLLKTANEDEAIRMVSSDWQGALPFTILIDENGNTAYKRQGKFKTEVLRAEIEKLLQPKQEQNQSPSN
jgi:Thiol-disulfide isomerase and thioredoxins